MRFISTNDIEVWANTVDCKYHLPHLIRKLILATINQNQIKNIQKTTDFLSFHLPQKSLSF